ncbi:MAG: HPr family phosphocarrier protein [Proteobacteria bacterium]|nr:MAG: HPr family phosphocarrier protein [Pseudomonadota bacterium]
MSDAADVEQTFTVKHKLGLHARPAGRFVSLASKFRAEVEVAREADDAEWVSGRSVLSLLSLAAGFGTRLRVRASGSDAEQAVAALGQILEEPAQGDGG